MKIPPKKSRRGWRHFPWKVANWEPCWATFTLMSCSCFWSWLVPPMVLLRHIYRLALTIWSQIGVWLLVSIIHLSDPILNSFAKQTSCTSTFFFTGFWCTPVLLLACTQKTASYYTVWNQKKDLIEVNNTNYNVIISVISFHAAPRISLDMNSCTYHCVGYITPSHCIFLMLWRYNTCHNALSSNENFRINTICTGICHSELARELMSMLRYNSPKWFFFEESVQVNTSNLLKCL